MCLRTPAIVIVATLIAFATPLSPISAQDYTADRAWVLGMLERYSPEGADIVKTCLEKAPDDNDFMEYWDPADRWGALNTIVHEQAHGYMGWLADPGSIKYYISPTEQIMVRVGQVFRTQKMIPSVPENLKTFRFSYIDTDDQTLGSQIEGAYGLLDEMAAYWLGTQASAAMLPRFEAEGAKADWIGYFNSVNTTLYGVLEFRFFVLKYLLWAKDHEPVVYKDILENKLFKQAFVAIDRRSRDFTVRWLGGLKALYGRITAGGVEVVQENEMVFFSYGNEMRGTSSFMDIYELLRREMDQPAYAPLLAALYDGKTPPAWPDSGVAPAVAGGYRNEDGSVAYSGGDSGTVTSAGKEIGGVAVIGGVPFIISAGGNDGGRRPVKDPSGPARLTFSGTDRKGDVKPAHADIVAASVAVHADGAVFRLELAGLPGKLPFNSPALGEYAMEYEWSFEMDADADGAPDYSVGLSAFKSESAAPAEGAILDRCGADVWEIDGNEASTIDVPVKAAVDGNAIIFTVADSPAFPLRLLGKGSFITARSYVDQTGRPSVDALEL